MVPDSTLHFGPFALDGTGDGLWCGPERCPLTAKAEAVLRYLVAHPGRLVRKDDLLAAVWPDVHVSGWVLTTCIREIRHVLGDVATAPRYIATVHRQGYRFIAAVTVADAPPPLPAPEAPPEPPRSTSLAPAAPQSAPTPVALAEEYRLVTILCGALADAPALAARLGSERWYRVLQTVVGLAQEVLHPYAGTLTLATSEGFTAVFGMPVAQEDHARRAVVAALELRQRLHDAPALVPLVGEGLALGLGLHSGLVVVGELGQDPQRLATVVGAPLQVATRLQQQAAPGTILLSAATYALVHAEVRAAPGGTLDMDGPSPPVPLYVLQGLVGRHAGVAGRGPRVQRPFVGRTQELALLHARLAQAVDGQGQVIGMVGEPGIGKSRLLAEWRQQLHTHGVTYLEGHCLSYGSTTPYLPVLDLLRAHCGITPADGDDAITAKVWGRLQAVGLEPDAEAPYLLHLLGMAAATAQVAGLSPETLKLHTFVTLRQLWLQSSQQHPLILAVEDLHWSDPTSAEFLASLVERLPGTALLVLGTYRPGYRPAWLEKSYATQLTVPPLSAQDSVQVLRAVLQRETVSLPLAEALLARAQGNPFFLEELARTLVEQDVGQDALMSQSPRPRSSLTDLQLPPTVQAVLASRIDRLPPEDKHLLQTAAVIGTDVPVPLLQAIAELPEAPLHQGLVHLQAVEFLYETRLFPEPAYTFKHALTHEVAYSSLLQERRRALHARIVEAMEQRYADRLAEQVEQLAHHALRGEVWAKAITYCQQAGARAFDRAALHEAVAACEQALQALAHLPDDSDTRVLALELCLALERPLGQLGEYGRQLALLGEAEALARALDDRARLGWVLVRMAMVCRSTGDPDGAIAAGQQARALAAVLGDSALQMYAAHTLGLLYHTIGDFGRAAALLRRSVEAADRASGTSSTDVGIRSRLWLARTLSVIGNFAEGRRHGEEALRLAPLEGQATTPVTAHNHLGLLYLDHGDLEPAIRVLEQGLALCRASGNRNDLRPIAAGLGYAYTLQGRLTEGRALLEEAINEGIRTGGLVGLAYRVAWLSEACRLAGRGAEAGQHARQALDLARQLKERGNEALALYQLGVVQAHADPPDAAQAAAHYQQALALAEELGMRPLQAHCHHGLGTLYSQTGHGAQARAALAAAIAFYRDMEMSFWLPQAEAALAQASRGEEPEGGLP
jgi:class 3 adenylate cyclase/tetratricopeptide (TPR) repeat protein